MVRMADPRDRIDELGEALELADRAARDYLRDFADDPVQPAGSVERLDAFAPSLPEDGKGAPAAVAELARLGIESATRSSGPRFFHFVIGGTTPAALAADWLTSALDQNVGLWVASPLGTRLEMVAIEWLRELFELPPAFGGVLTSGGTMANFVALSAARDWCGQRRGVRVGDRGMAALGDLPVLTSGHIHASAVKSLALLGVGRDSVRRLSGDESGTLDLGALERELVALEGRPAIIVANAGEVNSGAFDPIDAMADLAERHGAWLHVDGAFGLFARLSPRSAHLAAGAERASSVSADGHKWLNVPHDVGFAFIRRPDWVTDSYAEASAYLTADDEAHPSFTHRAPEGSRRARALVVWATLAAYGRRGHRAVVERHLELAQRLARRIDAEPHFERLAEVPLNIVCFRWHPPDAEEDALDDLNRRLGAELLADGRVFAGTTVFAGKVAFRPALVNWRTGERDVDMLVDVLVELAERVSADAATARG